MLCIRSCSQAFFLDLFALVSWKNMRLFHAGMLPASPDMLWNITVQTLLPVPPTLGVWHLQCLLAALGGCLSSQMPLSFTQCMWLPATDLIISKHPLFTSLGEMGWVLYVQLLFLHMLEHINPHQMCVRGMNSCQTAKSCIRDCPYICSCFWGCSFRGWYQLVAPLTGPGGTVWCDMVKGWPPFSHFITEDWRASFLNIIPQDVFHCRLCPLRSSLLELMSQ